MQTFDWPATVPVQVAPAGMATLNGCVFNQSLLSLLVKATYIVFVDIRGTLVNP